MAKRTHSLRILVSVVLLLAAPTKLLAQSAELFLQSLDAPPGTFAQGDSITIQAHVLNIGDDDSGPYAITVFASSDLSLSEDDVPLGTEQRPSLPIGVADDSPVEAMIPLNLAPDQYFIIGSIDFDDDFPDNNVNFDGTPIEVIESTGSVFVIDNWLNDAWFNAATSGQGFFITVFPEIRAIFVAWFTYDTERPPEDVVALLGEPGHRWLTAFGDYAGNIATLDIELTQGGVFDTAQPAPTQSGYGTIEIEFIDCNNAILRYDIPSLGLMGEIPITRVALDNVPRCEAGQT